MTPPGPLGEGLRGAPMNPYEPLNISPFVEKAQQYGWDVTVIGGDALDCLPDPREWYHDKVSVTLTRENDACVKAEATIADQWDPEHDCYRQEPAIDISYSDARHHRKSHHLHDHGQMHDWPSAIQELYDLIKEFKACLLLDVPLHGES